MSNSEAQSLSKFIPKKFQNEKYFSIDSLMQKLVSVKLKEIAEGKHYEAKVSGLFGDDCILWTTPKIKDRFLQGKVSLNIRSLAKQPPANVKLVILSENMDLRIMLRHSNATLILGSLATGKLDVRLNGNTTKVIIGDRIVTRGLRIAAHEGDIIIGAGCLIGEGSVLQGHDAHGIIDIKTRTIVNNSVVTTELEPYVWLAQRVIVMPGKKVGTGSIVGAGSIVTRDVPSCCLAVGAPAKTVRKGVTWSRNYSEIDKFATEFLNGLPESLIID